MNNNRLHAGRIGLLLVILGGTVEILMKLFDHAEPASMIAVGIFVFAGAVLFVMVGV